MTAVLDPASRVGFALAYNGVLLLTFAALYGLLGLESNFLVPEHLRKGSAVLNPLYFSLQTQCRISYGDIQARSATARVLASVQIVLSYGGLLFMLRP